MFAKGPRVITLEDVANLGDNSGTSFFPNKNKLPKKDTQQLFKKQELIIGEKVDISTVPILEEKIEQINTEPIKEEKIQKVETVIQPIFNETAETKPTIVDEKPVNKYEIKKEKIIWL